MALFALTLKNGKQNTFMWVVWDDTNWPVKAERPRRKPARRKKKEKEKGRHNYGKCFLTASPWA